VETIKRKTRAMYSFMAARQSTWVQAWTAQPVVCTPALSVTHSTDAAAVCSLWRYVSAMPLEIGWEILAFLTPQSCNKPQNWGTGTNEGLSSWWPSNPSKFRAHKWYVRDFSHVDRQNDRVGIISRVDGHLKTNTHTHTHTRPKYNENGK